MTEAKPIPSMSFEEALGELDGIVKSLESGQAPLDQAIGAYERGVALKTHCETKLREAQAKIEKITVGADGSLKTEPLDQE
ncbi:MAG: exodeoxyribonuclease VII small subunit [Alphaproteobacteria bacterium]|nr:exodeoxyribonuclease VII small subunit [Alphaproteobacteria bacterium]MCD8520025.1 exodeoxyribonuclease VII small subunit [Alphaproteobacteria bacterium]MCD8526261.1 exodeoxyribonuclease VII small subunit [Alphaproteobacteria bacterium]MCD8570717.1 exodeoxyribonuclease VII small subunit [Alphaproteobacteria bacterium]